MALAYSREFLFNRLRLGAGEEQQLPSDISNLVNYAGSIPSNDEANSIATSLSDSSNSPGSSAAMHKISFELGHSDDEDSLTDGPSPRRAASAAASAGAGAGAGAGVAGVGLGVYPLGSLPSLGSAAESSLALRFLGEEDDSDLEEQLLMAGHSPASSLGAPPVFLQPEELDFGRRVLAPQAPQASLLSGAISSIGEGDPLSEFISAAATAESSLALSVYFAFSDSPSRAVPLKIRGKATVHEVIGYALRTYSQKCGAAPELENPNGYNLRLHDEEGEPDDDFPALERRREIDLYSVDEVVLVVASSEEAAENARETPFETKEVEEPNQSITVRVYMFPFDNVLSQVYWSQVLESTLPVARVQELVCTEKRLDSEDYVVRSINTRQPETPQTALGALEPPQMALHDPDTHSDEPAHVLVLEIVPKRAIDGDESIRSPSKRKGTVGSTPSSSSYAPAPIPVVGLNFQQFGYYKYRIWRRQHVSFLGRQERELAIDGEYVYIMPPSDRSLLEQPKTTTFHIRRVIRCKQSSKVAVYLKIFVMKQTGPKRYDIDCQSEEDCVEIVQRINRLMRNF